MSEPVDRWKSHAPNTDCRRCPIESCDWCHDEPNGFDREPPELVRPGADTLAEYDGDWLQAAFAATALAEAARIDGVLRAHFEGHPVEDWVNEVARLRERITTLENRYRC